MTSTFQIRFSDAEIPVPFGDKFLLQNAPTPPVCLQLFRNGVLQSGGKDFLITGQLLTPLTPWSAEDDLICFYRF